MTCVSFHSDLITWFRVPMDKNRMLPRLICKLSLECEPCTILTSSFPTSQSRQKNIHISPQKQNPKRFQTSTEKSEMVHEDSLRVGVMVVSADLEGLNPKSDSYVDYSFAARPTTQVEKGDGKSRDWIDDLKLPGRANILAQTTVLVLTVRSGSEGPSRDVVIGDAIVPVREVLCRATLTAYQGVEEIVPYRVVSPSGKPIGTLNVSFRFDDMVAAPSEEVASAAARELSQGFDGVGREPVTKYPAPAGASKAYADYTTAGYARYALPQPQDSVYAPAGYALPPAVYGGFAPPPQLGYGHPPAAVVNTKNKFRAKLRAMLIGFSSFAHLASAVGVMNADVDPGTEAAGFGSDDGGFLGF